jgi:signal transduction histidine kinase
MVGLLDNQRRRALMDAENRSGGEVFIARIRVAITTYVLVLTAVGGDDFRYYPWAARSLAVLGFIYAWTTLAGVVSFGRRNGVPNWLPWATTALDTALILSLTATTGAAESPIVPLALLDVIAVAIRFDLRRAMLVTGVAAVGVAAVIAGVAEPALSGAQRAREAAWWMAHLVVGAVMVGVLSDLVDRARRHRATAQANADAEHRRLAEERRLRQRLEVIDQARKDFLHAIAHDFRTPIASLEALARALTRQVEDRSDEERQMLELMQGHARNLGSMLKEVREVAVTESLAGERQLDLTDVYMPELIWASGAAAGVPHDRLVLDIEPGLNVLHTDEHKLQRILANLLDNSKKHSPAEENLEVHLRRQDGKVELSVLDRGPGIPPELAARAFEKFAGFGPHRSWGLGMWIVSQFVWALGGSVAVEPRPGGGLIVRARFPEESMVAGGAFRHTTAEPTPPAPEPTLVPDL